MFNSIKSTRKGFTLIELLVVIAIIGILSSVVLASLATARQKARDATRISDIKNIQLALELYYDGKQQYPGQILDTVADADTLFNSAAWTTTTFIPTYIPNLPNDPSAAGEPDYAYAYIGVNAGTGLVCNGAFVGAGGTEPVGCESYLLGASLEREDNLVLTSDFDLATEIAPFTTDDGFTCKDGANDARFCYSLRP
jgi:prepilin-type N-terminal cleavage/methylation domain-containing protein